MKTKKRILNVLLSLGIFFAATALSILFEKLGVQEHITTVFVFAVFLISLLTEGYAYGVISAVAGMLAINYAFTYPYFALNFMIPVNLISAVIMVTISILTGMLTTKIKHFENEKAESERERMRANLLRAVSHDLRTPLTTIYSASTTLRLNRKTLSEEKQDQMLRNIQEDSEWLVRMVENLLSVTRIDDGKIKIDKIPTILDELIDSVMTKFLKRYPEQNVDVELPEEIVVIPMDTMLMEQVLTNLLENAVQHAKGMTRLTLRVYTLSNQAVFEVADDGCGINEEKIKNLFKNGYSTEEHGSDTKKRNAGIGLAVCATIIKAHGGELCAENRSKGGAMFRFSLEKEELADDE